jgi:hypothetical protein
MEVHHHSHTERKKWAHYFWEFLMLFLAVFCGFLAENFREHQVEHQREIQYMGTLLEDLQADTVLLDATLIDWNDVGLSIDSVADAIDFPLNRLHLSKAYRHINEALNYWSFKFNDRTITQLKNSGGFRLIRNKTVANKIIAYDQFNNDAVSNIALQHNKFYENTTALRSRAFLEDVLSEIWKVYGNDPVPYSKTQWIDSLLNEKKSPMSDQSQIADLFEFKNSIIALKRDYDNNMYWGYIQQWKLMHELINLIKKEYHLK